MVVEVVMVFCERAISRMASLRGTSAGKLVSRGGGGMDGPKNGVKANSRGHVKALIRGVRVVDGRPYRRAVHPARRSGSKKRKSMLGAQERTGSGTHSGYLATRNPHSRPACTE